jgi:hypothetical protein
MIGDVTQDRVRPHSRDARAHGDATQLGVSNINDLVQPFETGWFVPPDPEKECRAAPEGSVTQTGDVLVATRG